MQAYRDFRQFYNQSIHPELLHLERKRMRLLRLCVVGGVMILGIIFLQIYFDVFALTLILGLSAAFGAAYLAARIRSYFLEFKPRIVGLILDYIDNGVNFSFESFDPKGGISAERFLESKIFPSAQIYRAEDLIKGQIREMPIEMCELRVQEFSPVRNRLDRVFSGLFLVGDFRRYDMRGAILSLPDSYRKYLSRSERAFHLLGARRVRNNLLPEFEAFFDTYATPETRVANVLSVDLQRTILQFLLRFQEKNRQKDIYFSIIRDKIYVALTQDKNLLEPSLFFSNARYDTVLEFYEDLRIALDLALEVDAAN